MTNTELMNVVYTGNELLKVLTRRFFGQSRLLYDQLKEFASICEFHHEVQVFFSLDNLVDLHDVRVVQLLQNLDLSADALDVFLVFDLRLFENLDRHFLTSQDVRAQSDLSKGTLT